MRIPTALTLLLICAAACGAPRGADSDPRSPTPIADPRSGPAVVGSGRPVDRDGESSGRRDLALRADQAPLVGVVEALQTDSLLGRRVRVSGRCTSRGEGRRAGSWILDDAGVAIEVRGLVPSSCSVQQDEDLTIFAQIEPKAVGSSDRILLRLPD